MPSIHLGVDLVQRAEEHAGTACECCVCECVCVSFQDSV